MTAASQSLSVPSPFLVSAKCFQLRSSLPRGITSLLRPPAREKMYG